MKKLITILSFVPLVISAIAIQFMPEKVPMHYDLSGEADRYGSRLELLIIPAVILLVMIIFIAMMTHFEKKAENSPTDKERAFAKNNCKVSFGISLAFLGLMTAVLGHTIVKILMITESGVSQLDVDDLKFTTLLMGVFFIIAGNLCSKTKRNSGIGLRLSWTEYNDITWSRSNRFAGKALCIAGVMSIVSTAFSHGIYSVLLMLLYLITATVISCVYAHKVYISEKAAG